jgi:hypothetical protein
MFGKYNILKKAVEKVTHPERDNCCRGIPDRFETDLEILKFCMNGVTVDPDDSEKGMLILRNKKNEEIRVAKSTISRLQSVGLL